MKKPDGKKTGNPNPSGLSVRVRAPLRNAHDIQCRSSTSYISDLKGASRYWELRPFELWTYPSSVRTPLLDMPSFFLTNCLHFSQTHTF